MQTFHAILGSTEDPLTWWQMSARAGVIFLYALVLYRLLPRKAFGSMAPADIFVTVLMGSSLSRALTGNAPLLPVLVATGLLGLGYAALSWVLPQLRPLSRLAKGRERLIIKDGEIDWAAARRSHLGENDIMESLRLSGVTRLEDVAEAYIERNGAISVIRAGG